MFLDRPRTDAERQTDFFIGQAVLKPAQHRLFSLRQRVTHRRPPPVSLPETAIGTKIGPFNQHTIRTVRPALS
jgi:hypothetical protein